MRLFTDLLERSYVGKVETFASERIVYLGESTDGDHAAVRTKVGARKTEILVEYRLLGDRVRREPRVLPILHGIEPGFTVHRHRAPNAARLLRDC